MLSTPHLFPQYGCSTQKERKEGKSGGREGEGEGGREGRKEQGGKDLSSGPSGPQPNDLIKTIITTYFIGGHKIKYTQGRKSAHLNV